ncbi:hypothetical protein A7U60_g5241 [Sanghuangporus baumii]|uniref:J domain-containing protein n=1 Tax=Sanghuangporus baumii TaxID=108892 RepID=A0A9Q5HXC4_SANBA|nr:hypothetical protein A7U60_g5241 [Sanghuangporus baumii]
MHATVLGVAKPGLHAIRSGILPAGLRQIIILRYASTASADNNEGDPHSIPLKFPFPNHPHPTPHEIFHLKPGARPSEIKSRYYQLVRIHHPDTPHARRLPAHISRARFQAIQSAHDVLTGKSRRADNPFSMYASHTKGNKMHTHRRPYGPHNVDAEWARAAEEMDEHGSGRQKDQIIILGAIALIGLAAVPFFTSTAVSQTKHMTAVQNLAEARREAREHGMTRRREIRKRVRSQELGQEYEEKKLSPESSPSDSEPTLRTG